MFRVIDYWITLFNFLPLEERITLFNLLHLEGGGLRWGWGNFIHLCPQVNYFIGKLERYKNDKEMYNLITILGISWITHYSNIVLLYISIFAKIIVFILVPICHCEEQSNEAVSSIYTYSILLKTKNLYYTNIY